MWLQLQWQNCMALGVGWSVVAGQLGREGDCAGDQKREEEGAWGVVACPDVLPDHVLNAVPASGLAGGDDIRAGDVVRIVRL